MTTRIEPRTGVGFELKADQTLEVSSPEGGQVSDLVAFARDDLDEYLFNGKTFDYENTLLLTRGNTLWSNRSNPMLEIVEDTCGRHDFLLAPCCPQTFRRIYDHSGPHPSCHRNLVEGLGHWGIAADRIPTAFNIFMNVVFDSEGKLSVEPPTVAAGDHIRLRACMDLVIGLTACSAEQTNAGRFSAIDYRIIDD